MISRITIRAGILATFLLLLIVFTTPAFAQGTDDTDTLRNERATIQANTAGDGVSRVVVSGLEGCRAIDGETLSVTVRDADDTVEQFIDDGTNVGIQVTSSQVSITNPSGGDLGVSGDFDAGQGTVTASRGIICGARRDDDAADQDAARIGDDRIDTCEELLVEFRDDSSSSDQYGDFDFDDQSIRERVEDCLAQEVIVETIKGKKGLPDTGGPPLVGLAVLGLASLLVGASVIRGGLR